MKINSTDILRPGALLVVLGELTYLTADTVDREKLWFWSSEFFSSGQIKNHRSSFTEADTVARENIGFCSSGFFFHRSKKKKPLEQFHWSRYCCQRKYLILLRLIFFSPEQKKRKNHRSSFTGADTVVRKIFEFALGDFFSPEQKQTPDQFHRSRHCCLKRKLKGLPFEKKLVDAVWRGTERLPLVRNTLTSPS